MNNLWQQKRTALELWIQIRSTAWTLVQLMSLVAAEACPVDAVAPWLRMEFTGLASRTVSILSF